MGKIIRNGIEYGGTSDSANNVNYDNSVSGMNARTVQEGIDELNKGNLGAFPVDNLLSTSTDIPLSANQGRVLDEKISTINELLTEYPKVYHYTGLIMNSTASTFEAYGSATITVFSNRKVKVEYVARLATESNNSNVNWGINRDCFTSLIGGGIIPERGGTCVFYNNSFIVSETYTGYGGTHEYIGNQFWLPARVYTTDGYVGGWYDTEFKVNYIFSGTCYGHLS